MEIPGVQNKEGQIFPVAVIIEPGEHIARETVCGIIQVKLVGYIAALPVLEPERDVDPGKKVRAFIFYFGREKAYCQGGRNQCDNHRQACFLHFFRSPINIPGLSGIR